MILTINSFESNFGRSVFFYNVFVNKAFIVNIFKGIIYCLNMILEIYFNWVFISISHSKKLFLKKSYVK